MWQLSIEWRPDYLQLDRLLGTPNPRLTRCTAGWALYLWAFGVAFFRLLPGRVDNVLRIVQAAQVFMGARDIYNDGVEGRVMDLDSELLNMEIAERGLRMALSSWTGIPDERLACDGQVV